MRAWWRNVPGGLAALLVVLVAIVLIRAATAIAPPLVPTPTITPTPRPRPTATPATVRSVVPTPRTISGNQTGGERAAVVALTATPGRSPVPTPTPTFEPMSPPPTSTPAGPTATVPWRFPQPSAGPTQNASVRATSAESG
jgi:hypothetical protein